MKKYLLALAAILVLVVGYWLVSPLFITREVNEPLSDIVPMVPAEDGSMVTSEQQELKTGFFKGISYHNAEGQARLIKTGGKYFVRFEDDFNVTNGPDLFVHLGKDGKYSNEARLGALKGNMGAQNYEIPAEINPVEYNEVWVWCRAFSVPFAKAELK